MQLPQRFVRWLKKIRYKIPVSCAIVALLIGAIACDIHAGINLSDGEKYEGYDLVKGYESLYFHLFVSLIVWETRKFVWALVPMAVLIFLTINEINDEYHKLNTKVQGSDYINLGLAVPALFYLIHLYVKHKRRIYPNDETNPSHHK